MAVSKIIIAFTHFSTDPVKSITDIWILKYIIHIYLSVFLWGQVCPQWELPPVVSLSCDFHMPSEACEQCKNINICLRFIITRKPMTNGVGIHQLKEEWRLAQRLGCWVREVRERAALPLLWCGNTAGEKTLFILTARCGQTPCSLSNTWKKKMV